MYLIIHVYPFVSQHLPSFFYIFVLTRPLCICISFNLFFISPFAFFLYIIPLPHDYHATITHIKYILHSPKNYTNESYTIYDKYNLFKAIYRLVLYLP
jgi:hypothetical protein